MKLLVALVCLCGIASVFSERSFTVDYKNNHFVKDGKPFRFVSGSLHYYRVPEQLWYDRMVKMRAAGVNALYTPVEWSSHNPEKDVFDFTGMMDLVNFVQTAQKADLLVALRIGPYTCAERDMGGLPYWLMHENPNMQLRSSDPSFLKYVSRWFSVLLPKLKPLLYNNGGAIFMIQIENEYGAYVTCDFEYTSYLRDTVNSYLENNVILYTTDPPTQPILKCGKVDGVLSTVDFGRNQNITEAFKILRTHQQLGPLVNSEFYPAWLDNWELPHQTADTKSVCNFLDHILSYRNASVNIYMFHGGTNFRFTTGASYDASRDLYLAIPTSYDYDAPLSECGDPTDKYFAMRQIIGKYVPLPQLPLPRPQPKMELSPIPMQFIEDILHLSSHAGDQQPIVSVEPQSFEQLSLAFGFVHYQTVIDVVPSDPANLYIPGLKDRAHVFVDNKLQGIMSRTWKIRSIPIVAKKGSVLDIFVENQGRITYGPMIKELKGIASNVTLGPTILYNWKQFLYFKDWEANVHKIEQLPTTVHHGFEGIPAFYTANFTLPDKKEYPLDTFLRLDGWKKGVAFLNGFNLGRYWPAAGPQVTLYAPAIHFKPYPAVNTITLLELDGAPCGKQTMNNANSCTIQFVKEHVINATVPYH